MTGADDAAVRLRQLTKVYRTRRGWLRPQRVDRLALDRVDLQVGPGELFGLLGPNGAGKTTVVKILATLLVPTSGSACVLGMDVVRRITDVRRSVGFVFGGDRGLYGRLSGRANLRYFADLYGVPPAVARTRIPYLVDALGLAGRENDRVETYSRGMRQRLHLARGLLNQPRALLLDEPTIGLDPVGARQLRELVRGLADAGTTIFLTTHYMLEAETICDRIAVLKDGRIVAEGTPRSLKQAVAGTGVVEFETAGLSGDRLERLRRLPDVTSVVATTRELSQVVAVHCAQPSSLAARLTDVLGGDAQVRNVQLREATLEDAYVELVSR